MNDMKIRKDNVEDILALSAVQTGILYEYLIKEDKELYIAQISLHLKGKLDISVMKKACAMVSTNNEMLRSVFRWERLQKPIQIILKNHKIPFCTYILKDEPIHEAHLKAEKLKKNEKSNGIDIRIEPVKILLFQYEDGSHDLVITWHHIVYDGWSNMILLSEIFQTYEKLLNEKYPEFDKKAKYKDYIKMCNEFKKSNEQKMFWKEYLHGYKANDNLLRDIQGNNKRNITEEYSFKLNEDMIKKLEDYLCNIRTTVADFIYMVWGILLYKYTNINDFAIGVTYSGRNNKIRNIDKTIGLFINTLPLRIKINDSMKVDDVLINIADSKEKMLDYEMSNLIDIKEYSGVKSDEVLFHSLVVVENYPVEMGKWLDNDEGGLHIESYCSSEKNNYDLVLGILPSDDYTFLIQYSRDYYTEEYIHRMVDYLNNLLEMILYGTEDILIGDIDKYTSEEIEKMKTLTNDIEENMDFDIDSFL
ncbi:condensation domain-containing protein [Vallitalea maricola]|uniref:Uncharacterized protein n=1 Tax=Vallitalea maricola TaxID=3074433 RepID=A0ACB5UI15_9FIRM|nr:hypothetical protein AN2V17_14350 [Vallitalea sp. AN17-2]